MSGQTDEIFQMAYSLHPVGSHADGDTITSSTTLTPPSGAIGIMIQALTQNVRYTLDGTAPTATLGFQLKAGDPPFVVGINSSATLKVIEEAATADLQYQWLKA